MAGLLIPFLQRTASVPFNWGECDCLLFLADWVQECAGADPGYNHRGGYSDKAGADALIEFHGGEAALIEDSLESCGVDWWRTDTPLPGDIGVIETLLGPTGAICTARGRWVAKSPRGVARFTCEPVRAWEVEACRKL